MKVTNKLKTMILAFALSLPTLGAQYSVKKGNVAFSAKGFPTFITIKGVTQDIMGNLDLEGEMAKGSFKVPVKTLKTGMDLRDEHMINNYLEADKHPHAVLTLEPFNVKEEGEAKGTIEIHGVKRPVTLTYEKIEMSDNSISFNCEFKIKITDFAIDIPSFQGITVAEDVIVAVNFKAIKK